MFPSHQSQPRDLSPERKFDGCEIPAYSRATGSSSEPTEILVARICALGAQESLAGFIDESGIHFRRPQRDTLVVDLSREFVFLAQPRVSDAATPSAWQIFRFLQEPSLRALFVGAGKAILIEKSDLTLSLCTELDQLWGQERFLPFIVEMAESEQLREQALTRLMKTYEDEKLGSASEMWNFWDAFSGVLMESNLRLNVHTISFYEESEGGS